MAVTQILPTAPLIQYLTWTHTSGTAQETLTVEGNVRMCIIQHLDSTGVYEIDKYSISTSGSTSTVTIHCDADVTDGRIMLIRGTN